MRDVAKSEAGGQRHNGNRTRERRGIARAGECSHPRWPPRVIRPILNNKNGKSLHITCGNLISDCSDNFIRSTMTHTRHCPDIRKFHKSVIRQNVTAFARIAKIIIANVSGVCFRWISAWRFSSLGIFVWSQFGKQGHSPFAVCTFGAFFQWTEMHLYGFGKRHLFSTCLSTVLKACHRRLTSVAFVSVRWLHWRY